MYNMYLYLFALFCFNVCLKNFIINNSHKDLRMFQTCALKKIFLINSAPRAKSCEYFTPARINAPLPHDRDISRNVKATTETKVCTVWRMANMEYVGSNNDSLPEHRDV